MKIQRIYQAFDFWKYVLSLFHDLNTEHLIKGPDWEFIPLYPW